MLRGANLNFLSLLWGLLAIVTSNPAFAADLKFPSAAPVIDEYGLLSNRELQDLTEKLEGVRSRNGVEIVVYIARDLQGYDIAEFSLAAVEQWKLGKKGQDKGLLFLIAPKEKKMRFEVGYGLEGVLTDAKTRRILDNGVRQYFKNGRYYDGVLEGIIQVQQLLGLEVPANEANGHNASAPSERLSWFEIVVLIFLLVIFVPAFLFLSAIQSASGRGGRWRGGGGGGWGGGFGSGGGGSSWGGGGGGFGGGGSSSSW